MCRAHPTLGDSVKAMPRLPRDLTGLAFSAGHPEANQAQWSLNPIPLYALQESGPSAAEDRVPEGQAMTTHAQGRGTVWHCRTWIWGSRQL